MSKLKFTPEMFNNFSDGSFTLGMSSTDAICYFAQRAFDRWLEKQTVVYGLKDGHWTQEKFNYDTHKARLVCIEELKPKKCEHEPLFTDDNKVLHVEPFECAKCGIKLKPKWEPA